MRRALSLAALLVACGSIGGGPGELDDPRGTPGGEPDALFGPSCAQGCWQVTFPLQTTYQPWLVPDGEGGAHLIAGGTEVIDTGGQPIPLEPAYAYILLHINAQGRLDRTAALPFTQPVDMVPVGAGGLAVAGTYRTSSEFMGQELNVPDTAGLVLVLDHAWGVRWAVGFTPNPYTTQLGGSREIDGLILAGARTIWRPDASAELITSTSDAATGSEVVSRFTGEGEPLYSLRSAEFGPVAVTEGGGSILTGMQVAPFEDGTTLPIPPGYQAPAWYVASVGGDGAFEWVTTTGQRVELGGGPTRAFATGGRLFLMGHNGYGALSHSLDEAVYQVLYGDVPATVPAIGVVVNGWYADLDLATGAYGSVSYPQMLDPPLSGSQNVRALGGWAADGRLTVVGEVMAFISSTGELDGGTVQVADQTWPATGGYLAELTAADTATWLRGEVGRQNVLRDIAAVASDGAHLFVLTDGTAGLDWGALTSEVAPGMLIRAPL